jgi:hypothetical protein
MNGGAFARVIKYLYFSGKSVTDDDYFKALVVPILCNHLKTVCYGGFCSGATE